MKGKVIEVKVFWQPLFLNSLLPISKQHVLIKFDKITNNFREAYYPVHLWGVD